MKRRLNLYILLIVFVCSTVISGIMFFHGNRIFREMVVQEKEMLTKQITKDLTFFQSTLELVGNQIINESKNKIVNAADELNETWKMAQKVPVDTLKKIAQKIGVDEIFLIDKDGVIVNTTLPEELNYDLKNEGDEFFRFYQNLFLTHAFQFYSWGISSVDNSLNVYSYYVPKNAQYAFETAINLNNYLNKLNPVYFQAGVISQLNFVVSTYNAMVQSIDLYNLNDAFKSSLLAPHKRLDLTEEQWDELNTWGFLNVEFNSGETYYRVIEIKENQKGFPPKLILEAEFNYSKQIDYVKHVISFNVIILLIILLFVALTSPLLIDRLFLNKISIINFNLNALRFANYNFLKSFSGNDELSAIAENIEHVKESVVEREKQLKEAKLMAEAADKLKSAFLANMSHEIRTPLNAVVGFSQLLRDANPSPTDVNRYVGLINSNSNKLLQIINDIIDLSQIESGMLKIFKKPICLSDMFNELYGFAQSKLHSENLVYNNKSIGIFIEGEKISPGNCILTDPYRLRQIMEQLIDNAIKFTCKGEIKLGYRAINNQVELFVSDTGVGIADENISKIFDRFVQAEDYMTREFGGTGLGLAICSELVKMLDATIHVESKLSEGSTFSIRFTDAIIVK